MSKLDLRPVGYVIGWLVGGLGAAMLLPMLADLAAGQEHWGVFLQSAVVTGTCGGLTAIACSSGLREGLTLQQTFLLTSGVWVALPLFGAIPFLIGATELSVVDAFFEAMSGFTTTGSTVLSRIEELPPGILMWRGLLQWIGGIGIIVVAMAFLPQLGVGGMQIFRSESFDTFGKILPRATQISYRISVIYLSLTLACALCYSAAGMDLFDASVHAMTTVSTGGLANYDDSFGGFTGPAQYIAVVFMLLAALPFVRYVQLVSGHATPLFRDTQIRAFLITLFGIVVFIAAWRSLDGGAPDEEMFRTTLFNVASLITGTGYSVGDYTLWGAMPIAVLFFTGLIGGCAGSTSCSVKVFRYQLLFASIRAQLMLIRAPDAVFTPRYEGRAITRDVLDSVMTFFVFFIVSLGVIAVALGMTGLDLTTSVSGAATALANVGPGLGAEIGPAGNFAGLNDTAKWILIFAMLLGRLELMVVFTVLTFQFWRA